MSPVEIVTLVVGTAGGAGVLVVALGAWLGKVWSARIQEADKAHYAKQIEQLRSDLELTRLQQQRIGNAQFEMYSDVWNRLQDLKTIADKLWERATLDTLQDFRRSLYDARKAVNRGRLILAAPHFQGLIDVLGTFDNYQVGKARLIEIRSQHELQRNFEMDSEDRVRDQIRANRAAKDRYDDLLDEIVRGFKAQLGLTA